MSDGIDLQLLVTLSDSVMKIYLLGHNEEHLSPRSKRNQPHHTELRKPQTSVLITHICAGTLEEFICDMLRQPPPSNL